MSPAPPVRGRRVAALLVRTLGLLLVPSTRRGEWVEEWLGEVDALAEAHLRGAEGLPGLVGFALGAVPHAVWMRTEGWTMDSIGHDIRFATRMLARTPGFAIVAALTLALGIGANGAIFSLVNGLILRAPAGVEEPDRLVQIARSYESAPRWDNFSWPALRLIRSEASAFSGVAGYSGWAFALGSGADAEQVFGALVTGNYFEVLGARPHVGRLLRPEDDRTAGAHPVVVLSHGLWVRRFGADPGVVGSTVEIGSLPYVVVGVTSPAFAGAQAIGAPPALFVPTMQHPGFRGELPFESWGTSWIDLVGRLAPGTSFERARASMTIVTSRLRDASTVNGDIEVLLSEGIGLSPEEREQARQMTAILMMIVGLVLLLTCTNVANLFLARATTRRTEMGVRMALGAGRGRLVRQLVTESVLLGLGATVLAVPVVYLAGDALPGLFPYTLSVSVAADARVYAFLLLVGLAAGLFFGAAPAWAASRRDMALSLREGGSAGGTTRSRLRDTLVVAQLGLSLGLVAGASLLGRSVLNARTAEIGFDPSGVLGAFVDLGSAGRFDDATGSLFYGDLLARARELPGVRSVTLANQLPIAGGHSRAGVRPAGNEEVMFEAEFIVVGPDYFRTLDIPVLRGRPLGGLDDEPEQVVVVNEALAAMFWPGEDPIGKEIERGSRWRVVGVAGDVHMRSLRARPNPAVYYPMAREYSSRMALHVATESGAEIGRTELAGALAAVDGGVPLSGVVDLDAAIAASMGETRTIGYLVGVFAALALTLAVVGLYGLVSFGVAQRVREIGIRIALGAYPESLVRLILRRGLALSIGGVVLGVGVAVALGSALRGLLFGVGHIDPATLLAASALLLASGGAAAWLPARRASRVDAATSLRERA